MLKVSHQLNERMFGKPETDQARRTASAEDPAGTGQVRRSMYLSKRGHGRRFLHAFDCPDMTSDNQPSASLVVPTQSLALMNNPW